MLKSIAKKVLGFVFTEVDSFDPQKISAEINQLAESFLHNQYGAKRSQSDIAQERAKACYVEGAKDMYKFMEQLK